MPRVIDHTCRGVECGGSRAKWYGKNLHCTLCDAWQKEKDYVGPLGKEVHQKEPPVVTFTCPLCGKVNEHADCKKVGDAWRVWCHECSNTGIIRG